MLGGSDTEVDSDSQSVNTPERSMARKKRKSEALGQEEKAAHGHLTEVRDTIFKNNPGVLRRQYPTIVHTLGNQFSIEGGGGKKSRKKRRKTKKRKSKRRRKTKKRRRTKKRGGAAAKYGKEARAAAGIRPATASSGEFPPGASLHLATSGTLTSLPEKKPAMSEAEKKKKAPIPLTPEPLAAAAAAEATATTSAAKPTDKPLAMEPMTHSDMDTQGDGFIIDDNIEEELPNEGGKKKRKRKTRSKRRKRRKTRRNK